MCDSHKPDIVDRLAELKSIMEEPVLRRSAPYPESWEAEIQLLADAIGEIEQLREGYRSISRSYKEED